LPCAIWKSAARATARAAQSASSEAVGFETYAQLLRKPSRAQGFASRDGRARSGDRRESSTRSLPNDYIPQVSQKIAVYQQLAAAPRSKA